MRSKRSAKQRSTAGAVEATAGDALTLNRAPETSELTSMEGRVVHVVPGVGLHRITVDCGGVQVVARIARDRAGGLEVGQRIHLAFDPAGVHLV